VYTLIALPLLPSAVVPLLVLPPRRHRPRCVACLASISCAHFPRLWAAAAVPKKIKLLPSAVVPLLLFRCAAVCCCSAAAEKKTLLMWEKKTSSRVDTSSQVNTIPKAKSIDLCMHEEGYRLN
jgi:hypothetical protein